MSLAGLVACLAIVVVGPLLARSRRRRGAVIDHGGANHEALRRDDLLPRFEAPGVRRPAVAGRRSALLGAALATVVSLLVVPPPGLVAPVVGVVTYVALRWDRGRRLPSVLAAGALAATAAYYVLQQYRHRFPPDFSWPQQFEPVHVVGILVVVLLLVDAAIGAVRAPHRASNALPSDRAPNSDP